MDAASAVVAKIQLGKGRPVAARKRSFGATLLLQPRKRELDVLTAAELARCIIGARAEIAAGSHAPDHHAIARLRDWVADAKLGEKRLVRQVLEPEGLLAAELAAQASL